MTNPTLGLHQGIDEHEYLTAPGASYSRLKLLRDRSPAHVRWEMLNPRPPSEAMVFGTALHAAVLQPDRFMQTYAVAERCHGITKQGQRCKKVGGGRVQTGEWFCGLHMPDHAPIDEALTLTKEEYDAIMLIRDGVANHPFARRLLDGRSELSAWWKDGATDVLCKARFDLVNDETNTIVDLKTARDASPAGFTRTIYNLGYYIQGAHYVAGGRALGLEVDNYAVVAVEKEPPYGIALYRIRAEALGAGTAELAPLLERWRQCEEEGDWPSYQQDVQDITLPPWAWRQVEERSMPV